MYILDIHPIDLIILGLIIILIFDDGVRNRVRMMMVFLDDHRGDFPDKLLHCLFFRLVPHHAKFQRLQVIYFIMNLETLQQNPLLPDTRRNFLLPTAFYS